MGDKAWKRAERMAAALFGGLRNPLSGSNSHHTAGDVIHPSLYVEVKHRQRQAVVSLMRDSMVDAKKEGKLPVLVVSEPGAKWSLVCVKNTDLVKFVDMLYKQWQDEPNLDLMGNILSKSGDAEETMDADLRGIAIRTSRRREKPLPELTRANKGMKKISRRH